IIRLGRANTRWLAVARILDCDIAGLLPLPSFRLQFDFLNLGGAENLCQPPLVDERSIELNVEFIVAIKGCFCHYAASLPQVSQPSRGARENISSLAAWGNNISIREANSAGFSLWRPLAASITESDWLPGAGAATFPRTPTRSSSWQLRNQYPV